MLITVIVPTYKRLDDLQRCLAAMQKQVRPADQLIVVHRDIDTGTNDFLAKIGKAGVALESVRVTLPGQVHALNQGLAAARGEIIAITDDDAAPRGDWLQKLHELYEKYPNAGGIGGRDVIDGLESASDNDHRVVGQVTWFGRCIGNHHLGTDGLQEVCILKGANMSYARKAIEGLRFDSRLRGPGAQVGNDKDFSLQVVKRGWKLYYDPNAKVDHFPAVRPMGDARQTVSAKSAFDISFNEMWIQLKFLSWWQRPAHIVWRYLIGTRGIPGIFGFAFLRFRVPCEWTLETVVAAWRGAALAIFLFFTTKWLSSSRAKPSHGDSP